MNPLRLVARGLASELRQLRRHPSILLVLLGVPLLYPAAISWLYVERQATERPALVVDEDGSALSRRLTLALDATQELAVAGRPGTLDEALLALRHGETEAVAWFPPGLSRAVARGEGGAVRLWVGGANVYTYGLSLPGATAAVAAEAGTLATRSFLSRGLPPEAAAARAAPVLRDERALFHPTETYGPFLVTGILLVVLQQVTLLSVAYAQGLRRELGEAALDPALPFTELAGRLLAHAGFHLLGAAAIVLGTFPLFGLPAENPAALLLVFALFAVAMAPAAALAGALCPDRYAAFQLLLFASVPLFMASGFAWPLEAMPPWVRAIASLVPTTPALAAVRTLTMKSGSLAAVLPELGWLAATFAGWLVAAIVVVRVRNRPDRTSAIGAA